MHRASNQWRELTLLCVYITLAATAFASQIPVITVQQALDFANQNNIDLKIAQSQLQQVIRTQDASASTFLPNISLSAGISTGGSIINTTFSGVSANVSTGISMSFNGSMITDSNTRSLAKEQANLQYAMTLDSIEGNVIQSYWNLAAMDAALQIATLNQQQASNQLQIIQEQYDAGKVPQLTVLQAQQTVLQAQLNIKQLEDSRSLSLTAFRILTGVEIEEFSLQELPDHVDLLLPSAKELYTQYASANTTLQQLQTSVSQATNDSKTITLSARVPTVGISASWGLSGSLTSGSSSSDNGSVSLSVSVPLSSYLPSSTQSLSIQTAKDKVTQSQLQLQAGQSALISSLESQVLSITQSQQTLALAQRNISLLSQSYDLSLQAYEAGLLSSQELDTTRNSLLASQMELLSLRLNLLLEAQNLATTLGIDLQTLQTRYAIHQENLV